MSNEANKTKTTSKKTNLLGIEDLENFINIQKNTSTRLKNKLTSNLSKIQLADCDAAKKDKCIRELEESITQREAEIHKLSTNLEQLTDTNKQIVFEFSLFKDKFFQLETDYDETLTQQKQENENLLQELQKQRDTENQQIHELTLNCQELQQKLLNNTKTMTQLNQQHKEIVQSCEQMETEFKQKQNEWELLKKQVEEENELEKKRNKLAIDKLVNDLEEKDEIIKQCIADKTAMEKEKDLIIAGLKNKIYRIETAFNQPTKFAPPMVSLPQPVDNFDNDTISETSSANVALSQPEVSKPLANLSNNQNKTAEQNLTQRNYKFKRPLQPTTSTQQTNISANLKTSNKKRRTQPVRAVRPVSPKNYNEFSSSSTDEDDDNRISQLAWRPNNNNRQVTDTDNSEGFPKHGRI